MLTLDVYKGYTPQRRLITKTHHMKNKNKSKDVVDFETWFGDHVEIIDTSGNRNKELEAKVKKETKKSLTKLFKGKA